MPKRAGHLYEEMCEQRNIKLAILDAARGKHSRKDVQNVLGHIDDYAAKIQMILERQSYKPSKYRVQTIYDSRSKKYRQICSLPFYPDQIIFWCVINTIKPVLMHGMYEWCCGSIPGRGIKCGYRAVRRWLDCDWKNTKYCLKLDIHHFYQSIPHDKLMMAFQHKIKDRKMLWLIKTIVDSLADGLPIGNYTSQWFANFYLEPLDHYIKQELHIKRYVRYVDDMVLFSHSKKQLHKALKAINEYLKGMGLTLKSNYQIFPTKSRPVDFLGFQFHHGYIKLRNSNFLRLYRRYRKIRKMLKRHKTVSPKLAMGFISQCGELKHCNAYWFRQKISRNINLNRLKEAITNESKRQCKACGFAV
jgi:hypothetical protein